MLDKHTVNRRSVLQALSSAPLLAALSIPAKAFESSKIFVVFGSDPVMLNTALHLEAAGKTVHIVDTHQILGGAELSSHVSLADAEKVAAARANVRAKTAQAARSMGVELVEQKQSAPWFLDSSVELTEDFIKTNGGRQKLSAKLAKHLKADIHLGVNPVKLQPRLTSTHIELSNGVSIDADHLIASVV